MNHCIINSIFSPGYCDRDCKLQVWNILAVHVSIKFMTMVYLYIFCSRYSRWKCQCSRKSLYLPSECLTACHTKISIIPKSIFHLSLLPFHLTSSMLSLTLLFSFVNCSFLLYVHLFVLTCSLFGFISKSL